MSLFSLETYSCLKIELSLLDYAVCSLVNDGQLYELVLQIAGEYQLLSSTINPIGSHLTFDCLVLRKR